MYQILNADFRRKYESKFSDTILKDCRKFRKLKPDTIRAKRDFFHESISFADAVPTNEVSHTPALREFGKFASACLFDSDFLKSNPHQRIGTSLEFFNSATISRSGCDFLRAMAGNSKPCCHVTIKF